MRIVLASAIGVCALQVGFEHIDTNRLLFSLCLILTGLCSLLIYAEFKADIREKERKLDFSRCYHNQPHAFDCSVYEDIYCCDICGRPYDDVIHTAIHLKEE